MLLDLSIYVRLLYPSGLLTVHGSGARAEWPSYTSGLLTVHMPQEPVLQCALRLDDEQINHTAAIAARRAQLKSRPPELSRGAHEACTLACGVRRYEVGGVA